MANIISFHNHLVTISLANIYSSSSLHWIKAGNRIGETFNNIIIRLWEWICCPAGFPFLAAKFRWRIKFWALLVFADWFISLILFSTTFSDFGNRKHILSDMYYVCQGPFPTTKEKKERKKIFISIFSSRYWHCDSFFWVSDLTLDIHWLMSSQVQRG